MIEERLPLELQMLEDALTHQPVDKQTRDDFRDRVITAVERELSASTAQSKQIFVTWDYSIAAAVALLIINLGILAASEADFFPIAHSSVPPAKFHKVARHIER